MKRRRNIMFKLQCNSILIKSFRRYGFENLKLIYTLERLLNLENHNSVERVLV